MNNQQSSNKNNIPIPMIVLFAAVAVALFAAAAYYFYLTWATLYTVNGISVMKAPFFRSRGIVLAAAGVVATIADGYLLKLRQEKK